MKQQKGFTLIELIIVIVILGILAVTAAPRFIDIQTDARKEMIQGVKAAIQGASQLVYAKAAIKGVQNQASNTVTIASQTVSVVYGYPDASTLDAFSDLNKFVEIDEGQLELVNPDADDNIIRIRFKNTLGATDGSGDPTGCYLEYTSAASNGATPTYTTVTNDC